MKRIKRAYVTDKIKFVSQEKRIEKFSSIITRFFQDWETRVQKNLRQGAETKEITKALGDINISALVGMSKTLVRNFANKLSALAIQGAKEGSNKAKTDMNVSVSFDIDMTEIVNYYKSHYGTLSTQLTETVQAKLRDLIATGIDEGQSIDNIAKGITEFFDEPITVPAKVDDNGETIRKEYQIDKNVYAKMLARTEINGATNNGRLYSYQEANLVKTVKWFTNPGACPYCEEHSGETFEVAEAIGILPYHPNCRCIMVAYEYDDYKDKDNSNAFDNAEKIVSDPNGIGITELLKMTDKQQEEVERLLDLEKYKEAIELVSKYTNKGQA